MSGVAPLEHRRRWLLGSAAIGAAAVLTSVWTMARRPIADAPPWWPAALCLANATEMTPAKLRRAQRRQRGKLRAAAAAIEPRSAPGHPPF